MYRVFILFSLVTYLISPYQVWGVTSRITSVTDFYIGLMDVNWFLDPFDQDWIREDENAPSYNHYLTGEPSIENIYYNRFTLAEDASFSAVEIGITNDFSEVSLYLNGIRVFSEENHQSNGKNYFR